MFRILLTCGSLLVFAVNSIAHGGLIASYSADGNTNDSVAGRNGTLEDGAGFDSGILGQAFRLDGTNDFVSVPDDDVWTFGNSPFTISLWANFDTINVAPLGSLPNVFVGHDGGSGQQNKWVFYYDDAGQLAFHINDAIAAPLFLTSPTTASVTPGNWHHFALTRSGSTFTFYADGQSLGTQCSSRTIFNANTPLTIGQAEGLGFIDGRLDEIQIYDEALSAAQVQQLSAVPEPSAFLLLAVCASTLGMFSLVRSRHRTAPLEAE